MTNRDTSLAWKYHDQTKHSYWSVRTTPHYLDWPNMPSPFKIYPELRPIPLPKELPQAGVPTAKAVSAAAVGSHAQVRPTLEQVAALLYYSAGVTKEKSYPGGVIHFRAAACAGALYPIETYLISGGSEGLEAGVYHFNPGDFSLRQLRAGDHRQSLIMATAAEPHVVTAPLILAYTAVTWRSAWKYRDRSYRYHFWDNGTIAANVLAVASAHQLPAYLTMGFTEESVNKLLGIEGRRELAIGLLALGHEETGAVEQEEAIALPDLDIQALPLSFSQVDYDSVIEMHHASSLQDGDEVRAWRAASISAGDKVQSDNVFPLTPISETDLPREPIESVIQRRASTRRFAQKAIPFEELSTILSLSGGMVPADFADSAGMPLNDLYMIVNRVDGLEPGAYFFNRDKGVLEQLKAGDYSRKAASLTLDQDLGGDASVTFFFMADLGRIFEGFGNRGYRAAQMEAGLIGGRIYLLSYALGRGATGLTFYDDDVTEFFSPHAAGKSCIFVTSIGVPGKKPLL